MSKLFMYGTRLQEFEQMMMLVPNFTKRGKGLIVLKGFQFSEDDVDCRFCTEYSIFMRLDNLACTGQE